MPAVRRASAPMLCVIAVIFLGGVAFGALAALNQPRPPHAAAPTTPEPPVRSPEPAPAPPPTAKTPPKTEPKKAERPSKPTPFNPVATKPDPPKPEAKPEPPKAVAVSYEKQVLPVFRTKCNGCHGDPTIKGGLDLKTLAKAVEGGDTGAGATAGKPDDSQIWLRINDTAAPMPPADKPKLTAAEKKLVKDWILSGAK